MLTWDRLEQIGLGELRMKFKEMYAHTPRSFFNAVNGSRKKEDTFSKERWIMTREVMYAVMYPYLEQGTEKHDILTFDWERKQLQEIAKKKAETIESDLLRMQEYWDRQDAAKKIDM